MNSVNNTNKLCIEYEDGKTETVILKELGVISMCYPMLLSMVKLSSNLKLSNVDNEYHGIVELVEVFEKWYYYDDLNHVRFNCSGFKKDFIKDPKLVRDYMSTCYMYETYFLTDMYDTIHDLLYKNEITLDTFKKAVPTKRRKDSFYAYTKKQRLV